MAGIWMLVCVPERRGSSLLVRRFCMKVI